MFTPALVKSSFQNWYGNRLCPASPTTLTVMLLNGVLGELHGRIVSGLGGASAGVAAAAGAWVAPAGAVVAAGALVAPAGGATVGAVPAHPITMSAIARS